MRLIDADAFSEEMKRRQNACEKWMHNAEMLNDEDMIARANGAWSVFIETKLTLDKQPTVSLDMAQVLAYECGKAERKKGKWDFIGFQMFRCTACKHVFSQDSLDGWRTYTYEPTFPKFCPNCGAEMEQC